VVKLPGRVPYFQTPKSVILRTNGCRLLGIIDFDLNSDSSHKGPAESPRVSGGFGEFWGIFGGIFGDFGDFLGIWGDF